MLTKNRAVTRAVATIAEDAWMPVHYPGAVLDPDTGQLISDAEVAEVPFTAFASTRHPVTARLVVRRVRDRARADELFPVWRYQLSRPGARCRCCHRSVSPGRSPNPPCGSFRNGLSTVSAVRRGGAASRDWGSCYRGIGSA